MESFLALLAAVAVFQSTVVESSESRLRGHVVLGHEMHSFEPCGSENAFWVVPTPALAEAYESLSREAYAPVFVEVRGTIGPAPTTGFAADYEEQLEVTDLIRAAPAAEGHGCGEDLSGTVFRASGNEPFWNLRVGREAISFSRLGEPELRFPVAPPEHGEQGWVYTANANARFISITLDQGSCSDTMVGARYTWNAHIRIDDELFQGCAWEGDDAPPSPALVWSQGDDMLELTKCGVDAHRHRAGGRSNHRARSCGQPDHIVH